MMLSILILLLASYIAQVESSNEPLPLFNLTSAFKKGGGGTITCYSCEDCPTVTNDTRKEVGCAACGKAVQTSPSVQVARGCLPSCSEIPQVPNVKVYCCEAELCNSTSKMNLDLKTMLFSLFIFISIKYVHNF
ncbi:unnamed protein product [Trichobilharzia szidati]|nr:unnamed protein product [Trichobilharzia szidati]